MTKFVITVQFFIEIHFTLEEIKSQLNGRMINRILQLWSFHMKFNLLFIKLAKGWFNEFHLK